MSEPSIDLRFRVLGPIEVVRDDEFVPLDGTKPRTVLAALLLARGSLVSDARLSEYLWADQPPATSTAQLYTYVSRLRKKIGGHIARKLDGYVLDVDLECLDLVEFERLSAVGRDAVADGRLDDAATAFHRALSVWTGPALSGTCDNLLVTAADRLEEARLAVVEEQVTVELTLGRHASLLPQLRALVRAHPLRERFRAQLMTAYFRCDRQADALSEYDDARRYLADELGLDPGPSLRTVHRAVLQCDTRLLASSLHVSLAS